jgi:hypothetical protein
MRHSLPSNIQSISIRKISKDKDAILDLKYEIENDVNLKHNKRITRKIEMIY